MRTRIGLTGMALLLAFAVEGRADDQGRRAAIEKMKTQRISLDFKDSSIRDFATFLASVTGISFVVDPELAKGEELAITLEVKALSVTNVLALIESMHGVVADIRDGGVVVLTRPDRVVQAFERRVFDVRDLLFTIKDFPGPSIGIAKSTTSTTGIFVTEDDAPTGKIVDGPDALLELVKANMSAAWEDERAGLSIVGGLMVVTHTELVQKDVAKLLRMLRSSR